jgi:hypothetical protein
MGSPLAPLPSTQNVRGIASLHIVAGTFMRFAFDSVNP